MPFVLPIVIQLITNGASATIKKSLSNVSLAYTIGKIPYSKKLKMA